MTWFVKAPNGPSGETFPVQCDTPERVREVAAALRAQGYQVWIEDAHGRRVDESSLKPSKKGNAMPRGPKGQKRPADVIGNAVKVMRILTGEEQEDFSANDGKDKAAQSLGQRGGNARAQALSAKRRIEIARKAAKKRWQKKT